MSVVLRAGGAAAAGAAEAATRSGRINSDQHHNACTRVMLPAAAAPVKPPHFFLNCSCSVEPSMLSTDDKPPVATCVTSSK